ncbi:MAG: hypothetical protein ACRDL5_12055 [Solirubrobacteraceae bacterium]
MSTDRLHAHRAVAAAVLAALGLAAAGCGGSSSDASTGSISSRSGKAGAAAYEFADCMRAHGVSSFPDPRISSGDGHTAVAISVTPALVDSPAFKGASKACRHLLPAPSPQQQQAQIQARRAGLVSFSDCMRSHGFSRFPDPTSQGQLSAEMVAAAGIDLQAPATRSAGLACVPASHGQLTRAAVDQATSAGAQTGQQQSGGG